ncbi:SDR family oxidoreductase [Amycolatopsis sp. Hca4]|uniref:SDR family oxidoreductase n=1 Tax=Amycolatopsis sp. Hca4 TaxID=2742131 RepID=UPI0020CA9F5C|nr:SDR family oxidoreductase [Amycolatopsis sp. Hca4]
MHYSANKTAAAELVERIAEAGGYAIAVGGDVADEVAMAAAFDAVEDAFGGIDVLMHTAGIMRLKPIAERSQGMSTDSSPAISADAAGFSIAFRANTGTLHVASPSGVTDTGQGQAAGTSPAIAG